LGFRAVVATAIGEPGSLLVGFTTASAGLGGRTELVVFSDVLATAIIV
jgi:hypothetical protein